jgi:hypothetical protein
MLKLFIKSARMPEKVWLLRNTSFKTSRERFSTVPGFLRPSACRRSRNDAWSDERADDIGFSVRKASGLDSATAVVDDIGWFGGDKQIKIPGAAVKMAQKKPVILHRQLGQGISEMVVVVVVGLKVEARTLFLMRLFPAQKCCHLRSASVESKLSSP